MIGELFPFKDKTKNKLDRSLVVYSMKCKTSPVEYIGNTEGTLNIRIEEHRNPNRDKNSACKKHIADNADHLWGYDEVELVETTENDHKLLIRELLHILSRRPTCNKQLGSQSKHEINIILIKAYAQFRLET